MTLRPVQVRRELYEDAAGPEGRFYVDEACRRLEALLEQFEGRIKLIYMDPPFMTGDRFYMRVRVGEKEWRAGRGSLALESFSDTLSREAYMDLLRRVLTLCHRLLSDDGMIFVHLDFRASARVRLLMDEIFGEDRLLNEIIWAYDSGGRSIHHFSRKHDNILFYSKTESYDFNIDAVKGPRLTPRTSHMRRHVDPDGRVYRSIRSNGRVYTYYDDDPVAPSDVWSDLSHLQQRDPERTGYDVQKPLLLLERIVKCASREGDWVLDPFAGSGTALEAARRLNRRFIGIDVCPMTANIARRRLKGARYALWPSQETCEAICEASADPGVGFYHVRLERFEAKIEGVEEPLDAVDNWSVGYLDGEDLRVMAQFARSRKEPALQRELKLPVYSGQLALCVNDVAGHSHVYALDAE